MVKSLTFAIILTALIAGNAQGTTAAAIAIEGASPDQHELAEWAVSRYDAAGLMLPPLLIRFPGSDLSACGGSPARAYLDHEPIEIRICWNDEFMVLHELAHVWEAANVPAGDHSVFMDLRDGVESWASREHPWQAQGREHAANAIAWGLLEDPFLISKTYPNDPTSMTEAFTLLTSRDPLHDGGEGVQIPDRSLFANRNADPVESGR